MHIKGYDLALNHENLYTHTIMLNETFLFCIELNSSTSSFKYSIDVLLKSSGFSLYIDVNNEDISSVKGKYKHSLLEKHTSTRITSPSALSSQEISNIYILAIPHSNATMLMETRDLKVSLRILISEYSLTGGAISFLSLLLMVVIGIVLLLVVAAAFSCCKPRSLNTEKSFEMDADHDHHHHDVSSSLYYTNAAVLDKNV
ncbi:predicted protein [Naegleria gruberi]|uniref:Predicted protein n=1 Tax=Naegleria gruberi TaxID=5762 RepID=D2V3T7_NAEGR|nr:uncharacterized protein NAEGRDRAFT_63484 [Naegleria gruberi]EFC48413.1 predicted protein [Naegleria gruberi]|eukprot:XP_002681157.1 predicted protein [Naegleria gruberi strain NEG-M]